MEMTLLCKSQNDSHRSLEISLEHARFPHSHSASSSGQWTRTSEKRGHLTSVISGLGPSVLTPEPVKDVAATLKRLLDGEIRLLQIPAELMVGPRRPVVRQYCGPLKSQRHMPRMERTVGAATMFTA